MIRPLGVNIIVQKDPQGPVMEKGILIPVSAERTPRYAPTIRGTVLAVGRRVKVLAAGQRIALKAYCGDEIEYDNQRVTICREKDIVGLIQP